MMSGKEFKQDIRNCFKVIGKLESKCDARFKECDDKVGDLNTDLRVLIREVASLANSLNSHSDVFKKHSDDETENYKIINEMFASTKESVDKFDTKLDNLKISIKDMSEENIQRDKSIHRLEKQYDIFIRYGGAVVLSALFIYALFESQLIVLGGK